MTEYNMNLIRLLEKIDNIGTCKNCVYTENFNA